MLSWLLARACELKRHAALLELEATRRSTPHIISDVLLDLKGGLVPPDAFRVVPLYAGNRNSCCCCLSSLAALICCLFATVILGRPMRSRFFLRG